MYFSADLADAVREAAVDSRATLGEWLLDSYDRFYDRLDAYLSVEEDFAVRRSGLPVRRRPRRRAVRNGTQLQFALTGEELAVLDEHQERIGAGSRSEFFAGIAQLALGRDG